MNNRVIGFSDVVTGIVGLLIQFGLLEVRFKILSLYSALELRVPAIINVFPFVVVCTIFFCVFVTFTGIQLLKTSSQDDKLLKRGLYGLIFLIILLFVFSIVSAISLVFPIYNITSAL